MLHKSSLLFVLLECFFLSSNGQDTTKLNAVTVTSSKFEVESRESSKPVIVIDQEVIKRSVGKDVSQILLEETGLIVNGAMSNPSKEKNLYLQGAAAGFTLILIDGIPMNDPSLPEANFDLRLLSVNQIERIEVLTGSQSVLYGSDAIGGVINIITKKSEKDFDAQMNLAYGNLNTLQTGLNIGQTFGEHWEYRLDFNRYTTDGISEAAKPDSIAEDYKKDEFAKNAGLLKIAYKTRNLRIESFGRIAQFQGGFDNGSWQDADNEFRSKLQNYGLNVYFDKEKWNIRVSANNSFSKTEYDRLDWTGSPVTDKYDGQSRNIDAIANYQLTKKGRIMLGFLYQQMQVTDYTASSEISQYEIYSPYITFFQPLASRFYVDLGIRLNSHTTFNSNYNYHITPGWHFSEKGRLYLSYSTGFKAPTLGQLFGQWGANPNLKPQESTNLELGTELKPLKHLIIDLRYFDRTITDLIIWDRLGYANANAQNDQGLELRVNYTKFSKANIHFTYGYVDGMMRLDATNEDSVGLLRRPKHRFTLGLSGQLNEKWSYSLTAIYNGDRNDVYFNPITFGQEQVTLDSYLIVNGFVSYVIIENHLDAYLDIKNMSGQSFQEVYGFNGLPNTVLLGVRASLP